MQSAAELIDVADWIRDEDFAIFPVGSKPKRALFCPSPSPFPFLIAGHRYLFKVSTGWRINQHWSEVIAYQRVYENFDADTDGTHTWNNVQLICRAFGVQGSQHRGLRRSTKWQYSEAGSVDVCGCRG
ncbi:hypothetical protein ABIF50_007196 [Bradyrhizobium diazoefficiens]